MGIIDRRPNPSGKSHVNRQRFLRRQHGEMTEAVKKALKGRKLSDDGSQDIVIPNTGEPIFRRDQNTGTRERVFSGNRQNGHVVGDQIRRPQENSGIGEGAPDGGGEHDFRIKISYDEFVRLFLEEMGLPDLLKETLGGEDKTKPQREGFARTGGPQNLHLLETAENSLLRRVALKRPNVFVLRTAEAELARLTVEGADEETLSEAHRKLAEIKKRRAEIPFMDIIDQRFRRFERRPAPSPQAVMFCLMDVSGSMDEHRQELAKRFFLLMKIFLERKYKRLAMVFIRHTHYAKEVDEDTFFNDPESGGTIISTVLEEMQRIIRERYPPDLWNIYGAQISDGYNYGIDDTKCLALMTEPPYGLLQQCQFFAYVQAEQSSEDRERWMRWMRQNNYNLAMFEASLWTAYSTLLPSHKNFAMQKVGDKLDIPKVFADFFARNKKTVSA